MLCCKLLGVGASESEQSSTEFYSSPLHSILDTFSFDIQPWLGSRVLKFFPMHPLGSTFDHILSDLLLPHSRWTHELKFLLSLLALPYSIFMVYILGFGFWHVDFQFKREGNIYIKKRTNVNKRNLWQQSGMNASISEGLLFLVRATSPGCEDVLCIRLNSCRGKRNFSNGN